MLEGTFRFFGAILQISICCDPDNKRVASQPTALPDVVDFKLLADYSTDLICRVHPGGILSYVSPSSTRLLGWTPEEMVGRPVQDFVYPEDAAAAETQVAKLRTREIEELTTVTRAVRKNGSLFWSEVNSHMIWDQRTNTPMFTVLVLRDISKRKRLEMELSELALRDGLTGLINRRGFDEGLKQEWLHHSREAKPLSLLLVDVDRFKQFNDQYGHQAGDDCLRTVASAVNHAVRRPTDKVARYGGEEIAVILPNTSMAGAVLVAEHVRAAVETLHIPHRANSGCGGSVTVSIGVATASAEAERTPHMAAALLAAADGALYRAKDAGRNRVEIALETTSMPVAAQT